MKVLLIQPKIGLLDDIRSSPEAPLSLMYLQANLPKSIRSEIFDQRLSSNWKRDLNLLLNHDPENDYSCAAITVMTSHQLHHAKEISIFLKKKGLSIIWGGPHATLLPQQTIKEPYVDYVVEGEGEEALPEILQMIGKRRKLIYCSKLLDLKKIKLPDYNYIRPYVYKHRVFDRTYPTINIQSSRGCPNECTYCYNKPANKSCWRAFDITRVEKTIKKLYIHGIRGFFFVDDNFFIDIERSKHLFNFIIKEELKVGLFFQGICITDADKMDHEFLRLMEHAGVRELWFGIETGSERLRKLLKKKGTIKEITRVNRKLAEYKFSVQCNFMSGFPTETVTDTKDTINLIFRLMHDNPKTACRPMTPFVPYPCTEIMELTADYGYREPQSVDEYIGFFSNIGKHRFPWVISPTKQDKIHLLSMFFTKDLQYTGLSPILKIYEPIARFRLKNQYVSFMPEYYLFNLIRQIFGFGFK
ncbi:B12-binding domain-containing radical SAM protein [Candidatus Woesearchaeota archaeon]|nr:B12-binding domain-containing radical SAM protein [Candidatus Woesearchaeota archaeon]